MVSCKITCVDNGQQALKEITAGLYDLVIMDIQMPVMNGYETTRHLRDTLKFRHLPIVAMTANISQENRKRCLTAGMNDFIAKPINQYQMYRVLVKWLSDKNPSQAIDQDRMDDNNSPFSSISAH